MLPLFALFRRSFPAFRYPAGLGILTFVLAGCGDSATAPPPDPPVILSLESLVPPPEALAPGDTVEVRLRVRGNGLPMSGQVVRFRTEGGDGTLSRTTAVTDSAGVARSTWRTGVQAGERQLEAHIEGAPDVPQVRYEARVEPGPPAEMRIELDTLRIRARRGSRSLPLAFLDAWGNPTAPPEALELEVTGPPLVELAAGPRVRAVDQGVTAVRVSSPVGEVVLPVRVSWEGALTLTFDDGYRSVHTRAWPALAAHGLPANVGVVTQSAREAWPAYMTVEMLGDLHDAGWAMASHTASHAALVDLSDEELEAELAGSRAWLEAEGFRGAGAFVVPYHNWDARVRSAVKRNYDLARGRGIWLGFPETLSEWIPEDPMDLAALDVDYYRLDTPALRQELRELIADAMAGGYYVELFFHDIPPENLETFEAIVEVVAEFAAHVVTFADLLAEADGS